MLVPGTNWKTCHLWSVSKFARAVAKWTQACDRRFAKLISYIHHTNDSRQNCHVETTAQHCRLGLFKDSDFVGDLEDSKSMSGSLMYLGNRTFVSIFWMCKKQTSVSHSSTEAEIISLEAGLRMDGLLALDIWDVVIEVLHSTKLVPRNWCGTGDHMRNKNKTKAQTSSVSGKRDGERSNRDVDQLSIVDYVPTNTHILLKASLSCTSLKTMRQ